MITVETKRTTNSAKSEATSTPLQYEVESMLGETSKSQVSQGIAATLTQNYTHDAYLEY